MKKIMLSDKFCFFFCLFVMVITIVVGAYFPLYSFEQGIFLGFYLFTNVQALLSFIDIIIRRLKKLDSAENKEN